MLLDLHPMLTSTRRHGPYFDQGERREFRELQLGEHDALHRLRASIVQAQRHGFAGFLFSLPDDDEQAGP